MSLISKCLNLSSQMMQRVAAFSVNDNRTRILSQTGAITIGGGAANDTYLKGVFIHTALAGTLTIDGFQDDAGAAQSFVVPASTPAGYYEFGGILNDQAALQVTLSSATDADRVMVIYQPVYTDV